MSDAKKRVLVVDDDAATLRLVQFNLREGGYEILTATNGEQALRILLDQSPALVVTDWELGGMSGLDLCRAIRAHEEIGFVYLIVLTGHPETDRLVEAFEAGADDYVVKPWNDRELLARLRAGERVVALEDDLARRTREIVRCNAEMELANRKLAEVNQRLERVATTDELTSLMNRRAVMARISEAWATAVRHGEPLACMLMDIDFFKSVNDTYGHATGDAVLRQTAQTLTRYARRDEVVSRIGGEEFLVVCSRSTADEAAVGGERHRAMIEAAVMKAGGLEHKITISVGIAERTDQMAGPEEMLKAADDALYAAKRSGRNRVCIAGRARRPEAASAPERAEPPDAITLWTDPREESIVLLVGPDTELRRKRRMGLEKEGLQICEAQDGRGALVVAKRRRPHTVVVGAADDAGGLEWMRELRSDCVVREIPILMIAPNENRASVMSALEAGADDCITSAHSPRELALRVRTLARIYRNRLDLNHAIDARGEQARMLLLLSDLTRALASMDDLNDMLDYILSLTGELASSRRIVILLPSDESRTLRIRRYTGLDAATVQAMSGGMGDGLMTRVFQTRETLVINAAEELPPDLAAGEEAVLGAAPSLCVALSNSEHVVGVLTIANRHGNRPFDPREIECIELIANIAASSIHDLLVRRSRDEARDSIVFALAQLAERRDDDTGKHLYRVTQFSIMLAQKLRTCEGYGEIIDDGYIHDLERAVPLHDIGKVAIPDSILLKPGKLTPEEATIMRTHAEIGAQTIRSVLTRAPGMRFLEMGEDIALGHHEWFNGQGYPRGVSGDAIPLSARLAAIADVYDAVTSNRAYRKAMPHTEAVRLILENSGTQFDPRLIEIFLQCERQFAELAAKFADPPAPPVAGKPLMRITASASAGLR